MSSWKKVSKYYGVKPYFIVNYETLKLYKYYNDTQDRIMCKYISPNSKYHKSDIYTNDDSVYSDYIWHVDDKTIFIFDEVHRASQLNTQNGELLFAAKMSGKPLMVLSATVADVPDKFKLFFWILNFIDPSVIAKSNMKFAEYMFTMQRWLSRNHKPMLSIHNMLYPNRASRMRIDSLGDLFPETQITAEAYSMGKKREEEIEKQYSIIAEELDNLKNKSSKDKENPLVKIMRAHQKIEMFKVPTFVELATDLTESKHSVVVFVNFTQTLNLLQNMLHTDLVIHGGQTQEQRDTAIESFQNNKSNIIICNIKAGGIGISLHDIHGGHPRASIISPPWSSIELVQALGRIHRAGGKTKSIQRIVYTANTIEEKIADKLRTKLNNLNQINDGEVKDIISAALKPKNVL